MFNVKLTMLAYLNKVCHHHHHQQLLFSVTKPARHFVVQMQI